LKRIVLAISCAVLLAACARGHDGGNFAYIGCHVVTDNPKCYPGKEKCVFAYGPEGDKKVGEKIYFKQLKVGQDRYGDIGPISTARPCREGE
jgi:hypothetical protein